MKRRSIDIVEEDRQLLVAVCLSAAFAAPSGLLFAAVLFHWI
jgi:hypothetical protein